MTSMKQQHRHRRVADLLAERSPPRNALERLVRHAARRDDWTAQLRAVLPATLAPHCRVASVQGGHLTIHVDGASWATRLRMEMPKVESALRALEAFAAVDGFSIRSIR